jgi:teichuronic acid biosynthesis glycosyltransferase TuaG
VTDVAVITPAHNSASVIERNIRSVGTQSLKPAEHIIVDDGSVDGTVDLVRGLQQEFPHLRIIRQKNGGAGAARNAGIEAAQARFIAFLDCDDYWSEQKLEAQIGFMTAHDVTFSYGDYNAFDAKTGDLLGCYEAPERVSHADFLRGCPIGCLTAAFDQEKLGKRYMPDVRRGQDWGFWLALTRDGSVARRYPGCHAYYRRSEGSLSSRKFHKVPDIYRIYREQERLGAMRAAWYLFRHIQGTLAKRPLAPAAQPPQRYGNLSLAQGGRERDK